MKYFLLLAITLCKIASPGCVLNFTATTGKGNVQKLLELDPFHNAITISNKGEFKIVSSIAKENYILEKSSETKNVEPALVGKMNGPYFTTKLRYLLSGLKGYDEKGRTPYAIYFNEKNVHQLLDLFNLTYSTRAADDSISEWMSQRSKIHFDQSVTFSSTRDSTLFALEHDLGKIQNTNWTVVAVSHSIGQHLHGWLLFLPNANSVTRFQ